MNKTKRMLIKSCAFGIAFIISIIILSTTDFYKTIGSLMDYKNDTFNSPYDPNKNIFPIIIYRISIYFMFPFVTSIFNFVKDEKRNFGCRLIENLESQFFGYSILSSIYYMFGLDVLFRTDIFGTQDSIVFLCSAIFTLVLDKTVIKQIHE